MRVDLQRAEAQHIGGGLQRTVDRAQMGEGVRFFALCAVLAQRLGKLPRGTVPARGNADPALPEAWPLQVVARTADGLTLGVFEHDFDAAGGTHAHGVPALIGNAHPGLIKGHGHQLLLIVAVPRREQGMAEHRGTGAPGLASVEQPHVPGGGDLDARLRRSAAHIPHVLPGVGVPPSCSMIACASVWPS